MEDVNEINDAVCEVPRPQTTILSTAEYEIVNGVLVYYRGEATKVVIPECVSGIGDRAFEGKGFIKEIYLNKVKFIGEEAFKSCSGLEKIYYGEYPKVIGANAFSLYGKYVTLILKDIEAFCNSTFANEYSNPLSVSKALQVGGVNVRNLVIPKTVKRIPSYAFTKCDQITGVGFESDTENGSGVTEIGKKAFFGCKEISRISMPLTLKRIEASAFEDCLKIDGVSMPDGVTVLEDRAFEGCRNISFVMLGYNLEKIGKRCFYGCSNLKAVSVPDNVKEIEDEAFSGCNIQVLTLGRGLKRIGDKAFESASGAVTVPESVERVGAYAFAYVQSVTLEHKRWKAAGNHVPVEIANDPKLLARCLTSGKIGKRYNKTGLDKVK